MQVLKAFLQLPAATLAKRIVIGRSPTDEIQE